MWAGHILLEGGKCDFPPITKKSGEYANKQGTPQYSNVRGVMKTLKYVIPKHCTSHPCERRVFGKTHKLGGHLCRCYVTGGNGYIRNRLQVQYADHIE